MPTRDFELTHRQNEVIESLVKSGRYRNANDVLGEALRLVEQREAENGAKLEALRAAIQVGVDAMEQGNYRRFARMDEAIAYLTEATDDILDPVNGN